MSHCTRIREIECGPKEKGSEINWPAGFQEFNEHNSVALGLIPCARINELFIFVLKDI